MRWTFVAGLGLAVVAALVLLLPLWVGETARAQDEVAAPPMGGMGAVIEETGEQEVSGEIKAVNPAAGTIQVGYMEEDENAKEVEKTVAFTVGAKAGVTIDDKDATLKDIKVGDEVLVLYLEDPKGAKTVTTVAILRLKDMDGMLKKIDTNAGTVVIETLDIDENGKETKKEMVFSLKPDIMVTIDGNESKLADIRVGDLVWVTYNEEGDARTLAQIEATREFSAVGAVKKLDVAGKSIVVALVDTNTEGKEVTTEEPMRLGDGLIVTVNAGESTLDQLKVGDEVSVVYSQEPNGPKTVKEIDIQREQN